MGERMQRFLERYDEDADGKVSRKEWRGSADPWFNVVPSW